MAVIKSWNKEAHGIKYHPVGLAYDEETKALKWSRSYKFIDENGNEIEEWDETMFEISHSVRGEMPWAEIPANVQDALITIDTFTKSEIRRQEGI